MRENTDQKNSEYGHFLRTVQKPVKDLEIKVEIDLFPNHIKIQLQLYIRLCTVNNTQTKI